MTSNLSVAIITESNKEVGFGHLSRCLSLYEAFKEKGIDPSLIINSDESISEIIKGKEYHNFDFPEHGYMDIEVENLDAAVAATNVQVFSCNVRWDFADKIINFFKSLTGR